MQLGWLSWLMGAFAFARIVHFFFVSAIVGFLVVHVTLVALVPKTLLAMALGRATARPHAPGMRMSEPERPRVDGELTASYVGYERADGYHGDMDMATALHPQTLITLKQRGRTLEPEYGYPFKIRIPTRLGFKNPKFVTTLFVTSRRPGGLREDRGYNWFSGS